MSNGDRIRSMSDSELAAFIFKWQVNAIGSFLHHGGQELLDMRQMQEWVRSDKPSEIFEKWEKCEE